MLGWHGDRWCFCCFGMCLYTQLESPQRLCFALLAPLIKGVSENGLCHTRHAVSVSISVFVFDICLLSSRSVPVWEECAGPDNPGELVRALPFPESKAPLAGVRDEIIVPKHKPESPEESQIWEVETSSRLWLNWVIFGICALMMWDFFFLTAVAWWWSSLQEAKVFVRVLRHRCVYLDGLW